MVIPRRILNALLALPLITAAVACDGDESALERGDLLWAANDVPGALAEYRLALARDRDSEEVLARVAHAYARTGQLGRAREVYLRLVSRDAEWTDQAVYDLVAAAESARRRGDRHGLAEAIAGALELRPGLEIAAMAPALARYYADSGDRQRAIDFYERALAAAPPDSAARFLYEIGRLHHAAGDCQAALGYLAAFRVSDGGAAGAAGRGVADSGVGPQARWTLGTCAYELSQREHREGRLPEALRYLDTVLQLGVPQNVQDLAWFDRGEILFALGREQEALDAYYRVLELNPLGQGQLVERARRRIDQIRFGA